MDNETYLSELTAQLQLRGVGDQRIGDIVAEVENHLNESGEEPVDAFGPADQYAEKMVVDDENRAAVQAGRQWHNRTFRATAIDEMHILAQAGRKGWELIDVGAFALFCRRPADKSKASRWEYKRRTGFHRIIIIEDQA